MKKNMLVSVCIAGFLSIVGATSAVAKPLDCDLNKCNLGVDGLYYCPKDACKVPT